MKEVTKQARAKSNRTKAIMTAGGALVAAALLYGPLNPPKRPVGGGDHPSPAAPVESTPPVAPPVPPPALPDPYKDLFRVGDRLVYDFSSSQHLELIGPNVDAPGSGVTNRAVRLEIVQKGKLQVDICSRLSALSDGGWLAAFRFNSYDLERKIGSALTDPQAIVIEEDILSCSLLVKLSPTGRIMTMVPWSFDSEQAGGVPYVFASAEAQVLWKDALSRWQVVFPANAETNDWEETESDSTGAYLAKYSRTTPVFPQKISKVKSRYRSIDMQQDAAGASPECAVCGNEEIEASPYQIRIIGTETLDISGPGQAQVKARAEYSYHLVAVESFSLAQDVEKSMLASVQTATHVLSKVAPPPPSSPPIRRPASEILSELNALIGSSRGHDARHVELASELIEGAQEDGQAVQAILEALAKNPEPGDFEATLTGILGATGTPAAQEILLDVIASQDWPEQMRSLALQSLVQVTEPIEAMDAVLIEMSRGRGELADSAYMILAAMGDRLQGGDPVRRDEISKFILDRAESTDPNDQRQMTLALGAIGNLGPETVPGIVHQAVTSRDSYMREQAVMSLQRIRSPEALNIIASAAKDSNEAVRSAAARMLGDPKREGGFDLLKKLASEDPSESVRTAAIMGMTEWNTPEDRSVAGILQEISNNDPSDQVRETATSQAALLGSDEETPSEVPSKRPSPVSGNH